MLEKWKYLLTVSQIRDLWLESHFLKVNDLQLQATIWMNLTDLADAKESNLRVHISYDFIYKKFRDEQECGVRGEGSDCDGHDLFLDLDTGNTSVSNS